MSNKLDWFKIRLTICAVVIAVFSAYYGQPLIHGNDTAINVIVTVFSILAGFLVAIIAVVGDPLMLSPGTWRAAEMDETKIKRRLTRHKMLFELYLLTLILVFLSLLWHDQEPFLTLWLERGVLFLGTLAFIYSFRLPRVLMEAQQDRIDAEIKRRRRRDGIKE